MPKFKTDDEQKVFYDINCRNCWHEDKCVVWDLYIKHNDDIADAFYSMTGYKLQNCKMYYEYDPYEGRNEY